MKLSSATATKSFTPLIFRLCHPCRVVTYRLWHHLIGLLRDAYASERQTLLEYDTLAETKSTAIDAWISLSDDEQTCVASIITRLKILILNLNIVEIEQDYGIQFKNILLICLPTT